MIKVIVTDDHPIVRAGLKQIIAEDNLIAVAGEARRMCTGSASDLESLWKAVSTSMIQLSGALMAGV